MIKSFRDDEADRIFHRLPSRKLPHTIHRVALRKLVMIDAATDINDLRVSPANHLEQLRGDRKGKYSIRVNDQWRVCFVWEDGNAYEIEISDYH